MRISEKILPLVVLLALLGACTEKPSEADIAIKRALEAAERFEAERQLRKEEQARRDKEDAPFDSAFQVDQWMSEKERRKLCGNDFEQIAVGWPIKKALTCSGTRFRLVSESGAMRIYQGVRFLDFSITVAERDGRVASWTK